jgi:hypothetical protein
MAVDIHTSCPAAFVPGIQHKVSLPSKHACTVAVQGTTACLQQVQLPNIDTEAVLLMYSTHVLSLIMGADFHVTSTVPQLYLICTVTWYTLTAKSAILNFKLFTVQNFLCQLN